MPKRIGIFLMALLVMASLLCAAHAQTAEKNWKKTITLPNGDVILDISGEWDAFVENYGLWKMFGSYPQLTKITQNGSSFTGVRMIDDPHNQKGSPSIQGDLAIDGFKNVYIVSRMGPVNANGKISEDGNKIVIDDDQKARWTLTRK